MSLRTLVVAGAILFAPFALLGQSPRGKIGQEVAIPVHLQDGAEFHTPLSRLVAYGKELFTASFTIQEGAGRPLMKGTTALLPVSDSKTPRVFPRNFNRVSGPEASSCSACHNKPYIGGGGDISNGVFLQGQRFDDASFDRLDTVPTKGAVDERGVPVTLQTIGDFRKPVGMFGSGFIEMLSRQITADLQATRNALLPGESKPLASKGIGFGTLRRAADGSWDTSKVEGMPAPSLVSTGPNNPPDLIIRPFHQVGNVISLRVFTNTAFNQHHGMQSEERFGRGADPDGDGVTNELTNADITAAVLFQATLPPPGQVIPNDPQFERAIEAGKQSFSKIGCARCHVPDLPLDNHGWVFTEPGPYNPSGNLHPGDIQVLSVDLTSDALPGPRLKPKNGVVWVPAFTDFKLHDISSGPNDPDREPIDMNEQAGSEKFFAGNSRFLTRRLWGFANQTTFGHQGKYTTIREVVLAHAGEALETRKAFQALSGFDQDCVIEFLKSLQILPEGAKALVVDENGVKRNDSGKLGSQSRGARALK